jgi:hypothetical protein
VSRLREAVERARLLFKAHRQVEHVGDVQHALEGLGVDISIRVNLPFQWSALGQSATGVRAIEPVTVHFPSTYPRHAPEFYARPDFDRRLAHVQPGGIDTPVRPCIFEGNTTELLHHAGLLALVDYLVEWFENAALGRLINPEQGWEPVRRDEVAHVLVIDASNVRAAVTDDGGYELRVFTYHRITVAKESQTYGEIRNERSNLSLLGNKNGIFSETQPDGPSVFGRSIALIAWAGKDEHGQPIINDQYEPETVTDLETLLARAATYACDKQLTAGLGFMQRCVKSHTGEALPLAIVLCVRRPLKLINSDSNIELCPYLVHMRAPKLFPEGNTTPVQPTAHRDAISPALLRRMAGDDPAEVPSRPVLLGCGSLGSKIAVHLTRRGIAPSDLIDRGSLSPHNAARHALLPPRETQLPWLIGKAAALQHAIQGFGQRARAHQEDVIGIGGKDFRRLTPTDAPFVINTTASIAVAETLAILSATPPLPRIVDASLLNGTIGILTIEGPARNPNIGDLYTETYARLTATDMDTDARSVPIGQGCSSLTMPMSDARISMFAAPMSEQIAQWTNTSCPSAGELLIGRLAADGISLTWERIAVLPAQVIKIEKSDIRIRLSARAQAHIEADIARWQNVETGGVLLGRQSETSNAFYISDVLDAPPDSTRSAGLFELGTEGLRARINDYVAAHRGTLYVLGTWHSHLATQGASQTDRNTAKILGMSRAIPSVMLIRTPAGYEAIFAG